MIYSPAFVYKWTHIPSGKWYIGKHTGSIDDGYICSSHLVKPHIEEYITEWNREILATGTTDQMTLTEIMYLRKLDAVNNPQSLNQTNGHGKIVFKELPEPQHPTQETKKSIRQILMEQE